MEPVAGKNNFEECVTIFRKSHEAFGTSHEEFCSKVLNGWSSHPQALEKRKKWWFLLGLSPMIALCVFAVFALTDFETVLSLFKHPGKWTFVGASFFALILGATMTFAILNLLSRARVGGGLKMGIEDPARVHFSYGMIVLMVVFGLVPMSVSFVLESFGRTFLSGPIMFLLNLLSFAPFFAVLLWALGAKPTDKVGGKRRPIWCVMGTACLLLALMTLLNDFGRWIESVNSVPWLKEVGALIGLDYVVEMLKDAFSRIVLLSTLLPLAMIFYCCWLLFKYQQIPKERQKNGRSFVSKILSQIKKVFTRSQNEEQPEWIENFICEMAGIFGGRLEGKIEICKRSVGKTSGPADLKKAESLWLLMGRREGVHPTKDQHEFFVRFNEAYSNAVRAYQDGKTVSADMILEGEEGSGRTEALMACALFSALVRRQGAVLIVLDSDQANSVLAELRDRISNMLMDAYLYCDRLTKSNVKEWLKDGAINPDILVATPRELESNFFGNDLAFEKKSRAALLRIMRCYEVVLVDDFLDVPLIERLHLTFSLHKLRLLLSYRGGLSQVVVAVLPLLKDGREQLSSRLFGITQFNSENAVQIHPRDCAPPWFARVKVRNGISPSEVCKDMVRECLKKNWDVVIFRKGISVQQCREVEAEIGEGITSGRLMVVSRLGALRGNLEPKAVFYLTSLSGDAVFSLRLNMGGEETVFVGIEGADAVVVQNQTVMPVLPDSSAHALRIHHLKSILPFVARNEPMDCGMWSRFGVFGAGNELPTVLRESEAHSSETWVQDVWSEARYGEPLWEYVVLREKGSVSNAGFKLDTSVLPSTTDDLYKIIGTHQVVLGNLIDVGGSIGDVCSSIAKWRGENLAAFCDLSHANVLRFGMTAEGDVTSAGAENVFTVDMPFRNAMDGAYCLEFKPKVWQGDGTDWDIPVRSYKWTIESVSEPEVSIDNDVFLAFDLTFNLAETHRIHRVVDAVIDEMISLDGQRNAVNGANKYSYKTFVSGIVLNAYELSKVGADRKIQLQRFSSGVWDTRDERVFSPVLTHVFAGVLRCIVPDFALLAICPAFYASLRDGAIGSVCFWLLQPTNSGKVVNDFLKKVFGAAKPKAGRDVNGMAAVKAGDIDAETFLGAMLEAIARVKGIQGDNEAETDRRRLHWLRMFAGCAYYYKLGENGNRPLARDIEAAECALKELLGVLRKASIKKIEAPGVPLSDRSWIMGDKHFDSSSMSDVKWTRCCMLPGGMVAGRGSLNFEWSYQGKRYLLKAGFPNVQDDKSYCETLDGLSTWRVYTASSWSEYGYNDPCHSFVDSLYGELRRLYDKHDVESEAPQFAEFLLSFVQASIEYVKDVKDDRHRTDWPRFPSETCARKNGDCEDKSILYMELLRRARMASALLLIPKHAAVGVAVEMNKTAKGKEPIRYSWMGRNYVYAETACSGGGTRALGDETSLISSASEIPEEIIPTEDFSAYPKPRLCVLAARFEWHESSLDILLACPHGNTVFDGELSLVCFLRYAKDAFETPSGDYKVVGGTKIMACASGEVISAKIKLDIPRAIDARTRWLDVYVCDTNTGKVQGHYVGVVKES